MSPYECSVSRLECGFENAVEHCNIWHLNFNINILRANEKTISNGYQQARLLVNNVGQQCWSLLEG